MTSISRMPVGVALFVLAATAAAAPSDLVLDAAGGSVFVTSLDPVRPADYLGTPDGGWVRMEIVRQSPGVPPVIGVSHSAAGLAVHSSAGETAPLTTSLFVPGGASVTDPPYVLRDALTGRASGPAAVRTVALDPAEPAGSTVLVDAGHVQLPRTGQFRNLVLVQRASGELVIVDHDFAGGSVRRTPLGFTPPIGSNKGSFSASPSGTVLAIVASSDGIRLFDLGDLSTTGPLRPVRLGFISVDTGWEGTSARLGIIAILIGLVAEPAPAVSYQVGDELVLAAFDGRGFREVRRQEVPAGAQGLMEDEGIFYFLLPYLEQEALFKQYGMTAPEPVLQIER